jgi:hypothetical protein
MQSAGKITDVESLIGAALEANNRFTGQVWWRGQRDAGWRLDPSVSRLPHNARSEQSLVARFRHKAPSRHPQVPASTDNPGWLFLMQHYRLPTRLLDWTESPLIACFFAAEADPASRDHPGDVLDTDGSLFALSPYMLNDSQIHRSVLLLPDDPEPLASINRAFDRKVPEVNNILAVRPSEVDARLMVQLSVFTLHGAARPIEDLPGYDSFLIKWDVPSASKRRIRNQLKLLGVRESSLFPDLEHLAVDVASTRFRKPQATTDTTPIAISDDDWDGEPSSWRHTRVPISQRCLTTRCS